MDSKFYRLPTLPLSSCMIRRKIGKCEVYELCENRVNLETKKPCSISPDKPRDFTSLELIDVIEKDLQILSESVPVESSPVINEVTNLLESVGNRLVCAVSKIGV